MKIYPAREDINRKRTFTFGLCPKVGCLVLFHQAIIPKIGPFLPELHNICMIFGNFCHQNDKIIKMIIISSISTIIIVDLSTWFCTNRVEERKKKKKAAAQHRFCSAPLFSIRLQSKRGETREKCCEEPAGETNRLICCIWHLPLNENPFEGQCKHKTFQFGIRFTKVLLGKYFFKMAGKGKHLGIWCGQTCTERCIIGPNLPSPPWCWHHPQIMIILKGYSVRFISW